MSAPVAALEEMAKGGLDLVWRVWELCDGVERETMQLFSNNIRDGLPSFEPNPQEFKGWHHHMQRFVNNLREDMQRDEQDPDHDPNDADYLRTKELFGVLAPIVDLACAGDEDALRLYRCYDYLYTFGDIVVSLHPKEEKALTFTRKTKDEIFEIFDGHVKIVLDTMRVHMLGRKIDEEMQMEEVTQGMACL